MRAVEQQPEGALGSQGPVIVGAVFFGHYLACYPTTVLHINRLHFDTGWFIFAQAVFRTT
jgi:hypothetical protein